MEEETKAYQVTTNDLRHSALEHYNDLSTKCHHWNSQVPKAIEFFYDYKEMTTW